MLKEGLIELEGTVKEILSGGVYRVELPTGHSMMAYSSGKIKKNKIKIVVEDKVKMEASVTDVTKGRIVLRCK